jgi:sorting nexin-4
VHELINYCNAAKVQLDTRDQKQVDFEELSSNLQSLTAERERLLDPSKAHSNMGIAEFMADKMNDTGRGKSERIIRLEVKISQVKKE